MDIKVLYFTKYNRKGASSRLRSYQYFPYLKLNGVDVKVSLLFNDAYLDQLYSGKSPKFAALMGYFKRFFVLFTIWRYDKIVIEYELFPYLPAWIEILLNKLGTKYIVDYDDAIFHNYDLNQNKWIRKLLGNKIDQVMNYSETTVVGNEYLANRAKLAGAKNIKVIPTVIDLNRYQAKSYDSLNSDIIIGWIGTKSTFKYVAQLKPVFEEITKIASVKIHLIGVGDDLNMPGLVTPIKWTEDTEVEEICKFDIGIMPLIDSPWEKGKCAYKLIQYMACSLPVVASPIGMNAEVVKENGILANHKHEWIEALRKYILDEHLRENNGLVGRKKVEEKYCLQQTYLQWLQIIKI